MSTDLSKYYAEICNTPLMSREEEEELFRVYYSEDSTQKQKNAARDKVIQSNLRFVFKQAKMFSNGDPNLFAELIAAGNEGLLVGFDKYQPKAGVKYLSYAGWWVNQRILKAMAGVRIVSLPIGKQQLATRIERMRDADETLTLDKVIAALPNAPEKDIRELWETRYLTYYIQDMSDSDFPIDPIGDKVDSEMDRKKVHEIVATLAEPHQSVIKALFGLETDEEEPAASIMLRLGLSKETFRKVKREALEILRDKFDI